MSSGGTIYSTNDTNLLKNIFQPSYVFSNGYFQASVNTLLPGNVAVGSAGTNYQLTLNSFLVLTLSDLQGWATWQASTNVNMNNNSILNAKNIGFGTAVPQYTVDATSGSCNGTINALNYYSNGVLTNLSGGIPAWARYVANASVGLGGYGISNAGSLQFSNGSVTFNSVATNILVLSNQIAGETVRFNQSGWIGIGLNGSNPSYAAHIGGSVGAQSSLYVSAPGVAAPATSNSFVVNVSSTTGGGYNARVGTVGANTRLRLTAGAGPIDQVDLDTAGNMTLINGSLTISSGNVSVPYGTVTSLRPFVLKSDTAAFTLTNQNVGTQFMYTNPGTSIGVILPSNISAGAFWTITNGLLGTAVTLTPVTVLPSTSIKFQNMNNSNVVVNYASGVLGGGVAGVYSVTIIASTISGQYYVV